MFYLCALGSNIFPKRHISRAILELATEFDTLSLSTVLQTQAQGMQSKRPFLNALFSFKCIKAPWEVKQFFNRLEKAHGRNRSSPLSKIQDRTLDLDIVQYHACRDWQAPEESYLQSLYQESYTHYYKRQSGLHTRLLLLGQLEFGQRPTTIHFDRSTGYISVVPQKLHRLPDRL